jgi:polyhydroxyalkanoate synthase
MTELRRNAPRPLGLYTAFLGAIEATAHARAAERAGTPAEAAALQMQIRQLAQADMDSFLAGVARYRDHPFRRPMPDLKVVARFGRVALCDMGGAGAPVLLVPSMINRADVLHLYPGASLAEALMQRGYQVFLLDWGVPTGDENLALDTAIAERLVPALEHVATAGPVALVGYCMGGLLALAAAALRPELVAGTAVAAMPWDFSVSPVAQMTRRSRFLLEATLRTQPLVSVDLIQTLFMMLDPLAGIRRLQAYGREKDAAHLDRLTAIEDWLTDGIPLERGVAEGCLFTWYHDNAPANGTWQVAGTTITPTTVTCPLFAALPERDVVVPPASAEAFVRQFSNVTRCAVAAGHVGLMVGRRAPDTFYAPLGTWLDSLAALR